MAKKNPRWGGVRIGGELAKLGIRVSATKIRMLLRANGLGPAPGELAAPGEFLRSQAQGILAFDFFYVESFGFAPCTCCSQSSSDLAACTS